MVKALFDIIEEDFHSDSCASYNLSVLISTDRLSFLISNPQQQILVLQSYQSNETIGALDDLKNCIIRNDLLTQRFASITVGFCPDYCTLVPKAYYDASKDHAYLKLLMPVESQHIVRSDTMDTADFNVVYAFDKAIYNFVCSFFEDAKLNCVHAALLESYLKNQDKKSENIFLYLDNKRITLSVLKAGAVLFHNTFEYKTAEDCLYYVLTVYKQLGLSTSKQQLSIHGSVFPDAQIYKVLTKYIKYVFFWEASNLYKAGASLEKALPKHFFHDLYSLKLCE